MYEFGWLFWLLIVVFVTESWGRALVVSLGTAPNPASGCDPNSEQ